VQHNTARVAARAAQHVQHSTCIDTGEAEMSLAMRTYTVEVYVVPPLAETLITGKQVERKQMTIRGYTLSDAKRRAGIECENRVIA